MLPLAALFAFLLATSVVSQPLENLQLAIQPTKRLCGAYIDEETIRRFIAEPLESKRLESKVIAGRAFNQSVTLAHRALLPGEIIQVDVHFHVIYAKQTFSKGYLSDAQINRQISVLNADFTDSRVKFMLKNITRTLDDDWYNNASPDTPQQDAMKQALRRGGSDTLNLYSVGFKSGSGVGLLGYATFPYGNSGHDVDDGVVIHHQTLPGGTFSHYNLGMTSTHEIGHWLGLLHTFQGSECSGPGDYVDDTPPESTPTQGCPEHKRTCGINAATEDPFHNFMDYSYDSCMQAFTPGQTQRMREQWYKWRAPSVFSNGI